MRVPIPLVILFSLLVVGGVWWYGTRHADFLTPPPETQLAMVRAKVEASLPRADHLEEPPPAPVEEKEPEPAPPPEEPKPVIEVGDLSQPPILQEYADQAPKGADHLIELATLLESKKQPQRALLAWERVLDVGKPGESQAKAAIAAIQRLRPTLPAWNPDSTKCIAISLHAGTGKKTAKALKPMLEQVAKDIELASAGILKVTATITVGKDGKTASKPAPVAIWLSGPAKNAFSTDVLSFTVGKPETLREEVTNTVFQVIRGFISHGGTQTPPPAQAEGSPAVEAMNSHITRLYWQQLGNLLNHPPEKHQ